jgi:integrase
MNDRPRRLAASMQRALTHATAPPARARSPTGAAYLPAVGFSGVLDPGGVPLDQAPVVVRDWFDAAAAAAIPDYDGRLGTARSAAQAYARRAKAANTRRAYRAGVRAWCAWCDQHGLPCLPARAADVVAFLAAERGQGRSVATVDLRRAAIRYLHFIAGCPVPTAEAQVTEAMAGMHRAAADAGQLQGKKLAATADILRQILAPIEADLAGLRDRALLLVGFAGALRRAELAAIRVEHLEPCERGLRLSPFPTPKHRCTRRSARQSPIIPVG